MTLRRKAALAALVTAVALPGCAGGDRGSAAPPADATGQPAVVLDAQPLRLATLDGVKVEGLAVRPQPGGAPELFFGTDDEHHGGILRLVPAEGV